ncbi:hypothetical protein IW138_006471, partial [Coemansia sp. RSA 986]
LRHFNNEEWYGQLYGMDTDSAFITVSSLKMLKDKTPGIFGDKFGQFKEEIFEEAYGIFVKPKCY